MISFYVYLPTGEITQTGFCPDGQLAQQFVISPFEIAQGDATLGKQYRTQDGALVDIPPQPGDTYKFNYATKQWEPDAEWAQTIVLSKRLTLLQESDWTDTASAPARLGQTLYDQWQTYRQALRDIPEQSGYPLNVVWPTPPQ